MAEYNIFEIIRSEKKNLNSISPTQVSKVFSKYYWKYMNELKTKFVDLEKKIEIKNIAFSENLSTIGNFLFHIFYAIYLTSFNIHISIFFLERASILFYEFISLSIQEKEYQVECKSYINDAIIFTYKKTIGNVTLENILEENKNNTNLQQNPNYIKLQAIRNSSFLFTKILNFCLLGEELDNFKKIYKNINEMLVKIYLHLDIDKFLYSSISQILEKYQLKLGILLSRILLDIIIQFINLDYFKFRKTNEEIRDFLNTLDNYYDNFIQNTNLEILKQENELKKNRLYQIFKEDIIRFLTNNENL